MKFRNTQELFESFPDTVLLVGNGKIENKGELIDSYECVIRFNDFVIEGYENDVGTKISAISFHNAMMKQPHSKNLNTNYEKYREVVPIFTTFQGHRGKGDILYTEKDTSLISFEPPVRASPRKNLSSGGSLALTLSLLFHKEVHLIGFDFWKTGHYYEDLHSDKTKVDSMKRHLNMSEELILKKVSTIKLL
jgi:hypothetical protein